MAYIGFVILGDTENLMAWGAGHMKHSTPITFPNAMGWVLS